MLTCYMLFILIHFLLPHQGLTDEDDPNPVMFGDYEFENSEDSLQYFPVQVISQITDNHF